MNRSSHRTLFAFVLLIVFGWSLVAQNTSNPNYPDWWINGTNGNAGVLSTDPTATSDDFAVANLGQLKNVARAARDHFDAHLPGGAGQTITDLVTSWEASPTAPSTRADYAAANLGQLKAVAAPFYDRLIETGALTANDLPWTEDTADDQNHAAINLGQLKNVFAFEVLGDPNDTDGDGLLDAWEIELFRDLTTRLGLDSEDFDGDGFSDVFEFTEGTAPNDPSSYPGAPHPTLSSVGSIFESLKSWSAETTSIEETHSLSFVGESDRLTYYGPYMAEVGHNWEVDGATRSLPQTVQSSSSAPHWGKLFDEPDAYDFAAGRRVFKREIDGPFHPLGETFSSTTTYFSATEAPPEPPDVVELWVESSASMEQSQIRLRTENFQKAPNPINKTLLRIDYQTNALGVETIVGTSIVGLTIPKDKVFSALEIIEPVLTGPLPDPLPNEYGSDKKRSGSVTSRSSLLPLEVAPDVLRVNSDFDEGRIDPDTGYAIPDCDDIPGVDRDTGAGNDQIALNVIRDHLDEDFASGDLCTDDLHQGFFGLNPISSGLDDDFFDGATVTIKKLNKPDEDFGGTQSGQIRFYAKWGDGPDEYAGIETYDLETLEATNLSTGGINGQPGKSIYGTSSDWPSDTTFYMEGVRPGPITLEFRYEKGDVEFSHEQEFMVSTHQGRVEWREEIRYQIRLQTNVAGNEVDIDDHHPGNRFANNIDEVLALYDYYRQLYCQREEFMWAGMARVAAGSIYAAMADLGLVDDWFADATGALTIEIALLVGQSDIFEDLTWQHRAYLAGGFNALEHVESEGEDFELFAWARIHQGVVDGDQPLINEGNALLLRREQETVVQPAYEIIRTVSLAPEVLSWFAANPMPGGPHFHAVVGHGGDLTEFDDRWLWISAQEVGMLSIWTGDSGAYGYSATQRMNLVKADMWDAAEPFLKHAISAPSGSN